MQALLMGVGLGLAAGISPGPLLTLVVTTALQRGFRAGLAVALAPLLSDLPIILLSLWVLDRLPPIFLQGITVLGGLFVVYLGVEVWQSIPQATALPPEAVTVRYDLGRGTLVNLLSPHPWLFWLAVGGPLTLRYAVEGWGGAAAFLAGFYLCLVGSKVVLAWGMARARHRLHGRLYRGVLLAGGGMLVGLGLWLLGQGLLGLG